MFDPTADGAPAAAPSIPDVAPDMDAMTAGFAYIREGLYLAPVINGTKDPGSVLGGKWQTKTFNDPQSVAAYYAGTDYGIALHNGRSGLVTLDVDQSDRVPEAWWPHLERAPFQSTRIDDPRRGHYVFRTPPGRTIGNSLGRAPRGWGEVRGTNGVIIVAPTRHQKPDQGGRYEWVRTGQIPVLPALIADLLGDAKPGEDSANDAEVRAFLERCTEAAKPHLARFPVERFADEQASGSRHDACLAAACWIARDAAAGLYAARPAFVELWEAFEAVIGTDRPAKPEFMGILAWAIGQATDERAAEVQRKHGVPTPALGHPAAGASDTSGCRDDDLAEWLAERPRSLSVAPVTSVPEFPLDTLPDVLARHVEAVATASLTPTDFAAAACLGALSSACAGYVKVQINRTYSQPVNLYLVPVAGPGEGKTPAFAPYESILFDYQSQVRDSGREERARGQAEHEAATERVEAARLALRNVLKPSKGQASDGAANAEDAQGKIAEALVALEDAPNPVTPTVVITGNATPEALLRVMADNGGRLSVVATEGRIVDIFSGAYGQKVDVTPLLMAYDGSFIDGHRIGREVPDVDNPALTLCVAVQPVVWIEAMGNRQLRDRGLIPRVLACYPKPMIGRRDRELTEVPEAVERPAMDLLWTLLDQAPGHANTTLTLSKAAYAAFEQYRRELDRRSPEGRDLHRLAAWTAKHAARAVRLAALLHLADDPWRAWATPISGETFARARTIAEYFTAHAVAMLDAAEEDESTGEDSAPAYLLRYLQRRPTPAGGWAMRDLSRAVSKSRFAGESDLSRALDVLADYGWVHVYEPQRTRAGGKPPSRRVLTHPAMHSAGSHGDARAADIADVADNGPSPAETMSASTADIAPKTADIAPDALANVGNVGNVAKLADIRNRRSDATVGNVGKVDTEAAHPRVGTSAEASPVTGREHGCACPNGPYGYHRDDCPRHESPTATTSRNPA